MVYNSNLLVQTSRVHPGLQQKLALRNPISANVLAHGKEAGVSPQWQSYEYELPNEGATPAFGARASYRINPGTAHLLTGVRIELVMSGAIVDGGGNSTDIAYVRGIMAIIDHITFTQGSRVFYRTLGDDDIFLHYIRSRDEHDLAYEEGGYTESIADRATVLGTGYRYIVDLINNPFSYGVSNFPLYKINSPLYINIQFAPLTYQADATPSGTVTGAGITSAQVFVYTKNMPQELLEIAMAVPKTVMTTLQPQRQRFQVSAGTLDFSVTLTGLTGISALLAIGARHNGRLNSTDDHEADVFREIASWSLLANQSNVLSEHGELGYNNRRRLHAHFGSKPTHDRETPQIHPFGAFPEKNGIFKNGVSNGYFAFDGTSTYELQASFEAAIGAAHAIDVLSLNFVDLVFKDGQVHRAQQ